MVVFNRITCNNRVPFAEKCEKKVTVVFQDNRNRRNFTESLHFQTDKIGTLEGPGRLEGGTKKFLSHRFGFEIRVQIFSRGKSNFGYITMVPPNPSSRI